MRLRKLSQAEIVGITIVMVIIMLGIVFVIRFVVMAKDENLKKVYDKAQIGANFIDAMLLTETQCNRRTMRDLIQNCYETYDGADVSAQYLCPPDGIVCTDSPGCWSCDYANRTLRYFLNHTLDSINQRYDLFICDWNEITRECHENDAGRFSIMSSFSYKSCLGDQVGTDSKQAIIPTPTRGARVIQIFICD